ncbi:hypothetical protein Geob_3842 [Geotalea daltonii FRC-32]|uniref:Lipoprotein n=1 Tax=Geotalea daltonii (strain DSM 22248 / JCM 15807 / FRC-32) TaxID=316067 RepID=A0A068F101_GEODF|nr:hypothetical protein Geob_3842 [Geotalea daltonii FRC-32]
MSILFRCLVKFVLLSGVITAAGCSWPSVKIGNDKYLLSPTPTSETTKSTSNPGDIRRR